MLPIVETKDYVERLLVAPRPGGEKVLAFHEHRLGVICRDPRLMVCPLDDHLVHRGDGVFETMKYLDGKIYQLDAHLKRMRRSGDAIFLSPPVAWEEIRARIIAVARAGEERQGLLRVLLGRGAGGFGIDPVECPVPSLYIVAYKFAPKPEEFFAKGLTAFRTSIPAKQGWLATIKSIDYLPNVLMRRETLEKGYDVPLCFDDKDFLAEGAIENICIVDQNGTLVVPEFTNCLAGTTLCRAMELLADEVPVQRRMIREDEVVEAREVIVVGTTADAASIVRYRDRPIHDARPGPVSKRMRELLHRDLIANGVPVFES